MAKDKGLAPELAQEEDILTKADQEIEEHWDLDDSETTKMDGKLIVKEEVAEGLASLHACECCYPSRCARV